MASVVTHQPSTAWTGSPLDNMGHPRPQQPSAQGEWLPQDQQLRKTWKLQGCCRFHELGAQPRAHHRQAQQRHHTSHAAHGTPSSTQTQMTTVKNSVYFPIKAELSFKNQLISLIGGCGAELQGQDLPHSLLQAKSYSSLRGTHQVTPPPSQGGCLVSAGAQLHQEEQGRRKKRGRSAAAQSQARWLPHGVALHALGVDRVRTTGPPAPAGSREQLQFEAVHAGRAGQGAGVAVHALHGSSAGRRRAWRAVAGAGAGTVCPGCRHRVNPEWPVHCCRGLA